VPRFWAVFLRQFKGIVITLNKQDEGNKVADICRESVLSEPTFYKWKQKYGGMTLSEPKRVKQLEEENARLKQILANQSIEIDILKEINSKKW
jgi:putative transposase